jgi:hypothetical protein
MHTPDPPKHLTSIQPRVCIHPGLRVASTHTLYLGFYPIWTFRENLLKILEKKGAILLGKPQFFFKFLFFLD